MDNNMMFNKEETKQGAAGISTQNGQFSAGFEPHDAERVVEPYLAGTPTQNNGNQYAYESQINQGIPYNTPYNSQNEKQPAYTYGNSVNTNDGGFYGSSVNTNDNSFYGSSAYTYGNPGGNNNFAPAVPAPVNRTFGGNQGFAPNNNMPNGNGAFTQTEPELEEPVSVGDWLLLNLLFLIPCVGLVMAIVWAFSDREKKSKSNFCKAYLIFTLIMLAVSILITFVAAVIVAASL